VRGIQDLLTKEGLGMIAILMVLGAYLYVCQFNSPVEVDE
jgi:uncharacterized membrane protein YraQ (UPF0718 family)